MHNLRCLLGLVLLALLLVGGSVAWAAPSPPLLVVNRSTGQCATMFGGDECTSCIAPEGWEILGVAGEVECPAGYTLVEQLDVECVASRNDFCCNEGHSGSPGNCEDLVINEKAGQCAFVDDVQTCTLPRHWSARPEDVSSYVWLCPAGYEWIADLACGAVDEQKGPRQVCPALGLVLPVLAGRWWLTRHCPHA